MVNHPWSFQNLNLHGNRQAMEERSQERWKIAKRKARSKTTKNTSGFLLLQPGKQTPCLPPKLSPTARLLGFINWIEFKCGRHSYDHLPRQWVFLREKESTNDADEYFIQHSRCVRAKWMRTCLFQACGIVRCDFPWRSYHHDVRRTRTSRWRLRPHSE